jgi:hypothetical protein
MTDAELAKELRRLSADAEKFAQNMRGDPEGKYYEAEVLERAAAALEARAPVREEKLREILAEEWNRNGCNEMVAKAIKNGGAAGYEIMAALAAMRRVSTQVVPPGWHVVPKEPTEIMIVAGDDVSPTDIYAHEKASRLRYQAMLAAAPSPPKTGEEKPRKATGDV